MPPFAPPWGAWFTVGMTVYVDDAVFAWRGRRWAHLVADELEEPHAFAASLGLTRHAFRDRRSGAHNDTDTTLRMWVLTLGAIAISRHDDRARMRAVIANAKRQWRNAAAAKLCVDTTASRNDGPF